MLVVAFRKGMAAGSVGHEVELLGAGRIGGCLDRSTAWIGDRPRRQRIDHVGVVWGWLFEIGPRERPPERPFARSKAVDHGRVGLQPHLLLEAVDEHRSNARALLGPAGLLLDDGGEDDELLGRPQRQVAGAALPDFFHELLLRLLHALDRQLAGVTASEIVAVRQQAAFTRHILDGTSQDRTIEKARDDLLGCQTFRDGDQMLDDLAFDQGLNHVADTRAFGEQVFAGFEFGARLEREHATDKDELVLVDHAFTLQ